MSPAECMKVDGAHRAPLSSRVLEILDRIGLAELEPNEFAFQSPLRKWHPLSNMSMLSFLQRRHPDLTVHGFRSSFHDWASEQTGFPHAAIERCLAPALANKVEAAYARSVLLECRREIMNSWMAYLV